VTERDTGGAAFPNEGFNGWGEPFQGMTLRDYFAAEAMLGLLNSTRISQPDWIAKDAYEMADAMLKADDETHTRAMESTF
jgi:hypothetical protein